MSNTNTLRFNYPIPDGFENALSSLQRKTNDDKLFELLNNDDSDRTELWLIQAPSDLNILQMDGSRFDLTGEATRCNLKSDGKVYEMWSNINTSEKSVVLLKPDVNEQNIKTCLKSFSGSVCIVECISVPNITIPEVVKKKIEIPDGLKQRYVPYGSDVSTEKKLITSDEIVVSKKRKHEEKKKSMDLNGDEDNDEELLFHSMKEEVASPKKSKRIKTEVSPSKLEKSKKKMKKDKKKKEKTEKEKKSKTEKEKKSKTEKEKKSKTEKEKKSKTEKEKKSKTEKGKKSKTEKEKKSKMEKGKTKKEKKEKTEKEKKSKTEKGKTKKEKTEKGKTKKEKKKTEKGKTKKEKTEKRKTKKEKS